ncbi:MAG TPA: DUF4019 domain-containing protein [Pyrinomonadaceae bacterium]
MNAKLKMKNEKWKMAGWRLVTYFAFLIFNFVFLSACALRASRAGIPPPAQAAIDTVSDDISEGRFEKIYNEAANEWQQAKTLEQSNEILRRLKEKLGDVKGRSFHSATEEDKPSAHTFTITYKTTFDKGDGMETFTLVERKGQWLLAGYFVNSDALK